MDRMIPSTRVNRGCGRFTACLAYTTGVLGSTTLACVDPYRVVFSGALRASGAHRGHAQRERLPLAPCRGFSAGKFGAALRWLSLPRVTVLYFCFNTIEGDAVLFPVYGLLFDTENDGYFALSILPAKR